MKNNRLHFACQLTQLDQSQASTSKRQGRSPGKKGKDKPQTALTPSDKAGVASVGRQVAVVLHRLDQLLWKLRGVVAELDRPRRSSRHTSGVSDLTLPDDLREPLLKVDSAGRQLLRDLLEQEERDGRRFEGSDEDEEVYLPPEVTGKRKRSAGASDRIAGLASHLGSLASTSGTSNTSGHSIGGRGQSKRLRSRNKVVDEWLDEEGGDDAYADLEDFLVA